MGILEFIDFCSTIFSVICSDQRQPASVNSSDELRIKNVRGLSKNWKNVAVVKVSIKHGNIVNMPSNIGTKFTSLQYLGIIGANLKYLRKANFVNMEMLRSLDLRNNQISQLDDDVFNIATSLVKINLSDNNLKKLPNTFASIIYLQRIIANNNQIEVFNSNILNHNSMLQEIHLWSNKLQTIRIDLQKFKKLRTIDFRNNTCIDRLLYCSIGAESKAVEYDNRSEMDSPNHFLEEIKRKC